MKQITGPYHRRLCFALLFLVLLVLAAACTAIDTIPDEAVSSVSPPPTSTIKSQDNDITNTPASSAISPTPSTEPTLFLTSTPTRTPRPAITRTPSDPSLQALLQPTATPTFPPPTPEVMLICEQGAEFTRCDDLVLGIEFEYPNRWGNLQSSLGEGGYDGYAYDYYFDGLPVNSGGRSRDYSEGRGRILTDFYGFPSGWDSICQWPYYRPNEICQEIKQNVVFIISLTNSSEVCADDMSVRPIEALAVVALEIPRNPFVNGFIFARNILSDDQIAELRNIFGSVEAGTWKTCDEAAMQTFDSRMQQIAADIVNDTISGETVVLLAEFKHLAESITFK